MLTLSIISTKYANNSCANIKKLNKLLIDKKNGILYKDISQMLKSGFFQQNTN
jgi:hypothetical protein